MQAALVAIFAADQALSGARLLVIFGLIRCGLLNHRSLLADSDLSLSQKLSRGRPLCGGHHGCDGRRWPSSLCWYGREGAPSGHPSRAVSRRVCAPALHLGRLLGFERGEAASRAGQCPVGSPRLGTDNRGNGLEGKSCDGVCRISGRLWVHNLCARATHIVWRLVIIPTPNNNPKLLTARQSAWRCE